MDAPPVQYTCTEDGVSIAYSMHGEGPPLLCCRVYSHLDAAWDVRETREWFERLGESFTVIRFDFRGTGMSERGVDPWTDPAADARAVLESVGVEQVFLSAEGSPSTPFALVALHGLEDRIERAVLWNPAGRETPHVLQALQAVREVDEELYSDTILLWSGWQSEESRSAVQRVRQASDLISQLEQGTLAIGSVSERTTSAQSDLGNLSVPLLVVRSSLWVLGPSKENDELARAAKHGERRALPVKWESPELGLADGTAELMEEFLLRDAVDAAPTSADSGAFQTILSTDLESSTALTQRIGDEAAQEVLRGHNTAVRGALEANDGREVKHTGDGIMASFPSAVSAVEASLAIQRELEGGEVRVRIGINAGEPIAEDDDLFGTAVQLAARITDRAEPGQVLVSRVVMDLCAGKQFAFTSAGDATMKGFDEPVALYQVTG